MIVQVDWYNNNGKWKYGGRVEIDKMPYENGIRRSIYHNQGIINEGWEYDDYYVVVSDIPEFEKDPNYRVTYSRLYQPGAFRNL